MRFREISSGAMRSAATALALLCVCLVGASSAHASNVTITYTGHMSSFRTTGAGKGGELFGNYPIELSWSESAVLDYGALTSHTAEGTPLPPVNWTLDSLSGSVHQDQDGDPSPDAEVCTASFSPRPGFSEALNYQAAATSTAVALTLSVKAPFIAPSFQSSIEAPEGNFCTANAVHITGEQAHEPPSSEAAVYAEYLAAYAPKLTVPLLDSASTTAFDYTHTFPNASGLSGKESSVTVASTITVDDHAGGPGLSVEFPDGKPITPTEPIPLIEAPRYPRDISLIPTRGKTVIEEEETIPHEIVPVSGAISGWKLQCPTALARCSAVGVVTTLVRKPGARGGKRTAVAIARGSVAVGSGRVGALNIEMTRAGRALLRAKGKLVCTLEINATAPGLKKRDSRHFALVLRSRRR